MLIYVFFFIIHVNKTIKSSICDSFLTKIDFLLISQSISECILRSILVMLYKCSLAKLLI